MVTGAASGIGRATSLLLAKKGCALALADIDRAGLDETGRLAQAAGQKITLHEVDVADRARMEAFVGEVIEAHGRVNIVVNNAGVSVDASLENGSIEDLEWLLGVNIWGVIYGCKFFLPHLKASGEGHIVNISSLYGLVGVPLNVGYSATKFAVRGLSDALRAEVAECGVGVTCVYPGGVATNVVKNARACEADNLEAFREKSIRAFEKMLPPEAAARAIVRGIERNKGRVLITRLTYVVDALTRLFPALTVELLKRTWRRVIL